MSALPENCDECGVELLPDEFEVCDVCYHESEGTADGYVG